MGAEARQPVEMELELPIRLTPSSWKMSTWIGSPHGPLFTTASSLPFFGATTLYQSTSAAGQIARSVTVEGTESGMAWAKLSLGSLVKSGQVPRHSGGRVGGGARSGGGAVWVRSTPNRS